MAVLKKTSTRAAPKNNTRFAGIQGKIKKVSDLGLVIAALFYGRAGTGKTTLASTFPGPILLLDIREKGTDSVSDIEDLDVLDIENWDEFESAYWFLDGGDHKYKTVVIDAVTQLQDYAVESVTSKSSEIISRRQWGEASGLLKTWIINYRDLIDKGINVVFLAHDKSRDSEEGEDGEITPSVGPRLMPSVASVLNAAVKLIGNTFIRESSEKLESGRTKRKVEYCLRIGPHANFTTKVRQPKGSYSPATLTNPNYDSLVEVMKGEMEKPAAKVVTGARKSIRKGK